ncbi:MAG: LysR family transcriptional regulator, partial [Gammaproteobacteria bacterium]|nr:LysR family transcriptional regulator [Gammaproteobacteria bacterium]
MTLRKLDMLFSCVRDGFALGVGTVYSCVKKNKLDYNEITVQEYRTMDRYAEMQTFVRVVESGSLSATSERMNIAKSAVSRRLADLESRLGVQLLHRTTRRINLTESGRHYYEEARRLLAELDDVEQSVASEHTNLSGLLRITAPLTFGIKHLSPLLNQFML